MLNSQVCRFEHFTEDWYRRWERELRLDDERRAPRWHRKVWEYCAVLETLDERGLLRPGVKALGFAVGREPIPALLAAYGVDVTATDQAPRRKSARIWARSGEHAAGKEALFRPELVARADFDARVTFRHADMNGRWEWPDGSFDAVWSCCALEHLGGLEHGWRFVERSARLLKPGGIAVHTTEYNVSSNDRTVRRGPGVIYRRRDVEELDGRLRREGRALAEMDFRAGTHEFDRLFDRPPYEKTLGRQHVKLFLDGYVVTSALLVVVA